ncbi:hypothetical protein MTYM_02265 [Methylococcales bacterium]|nr:hypothetical protein MTYM_02265 [Methylococcales bacterium]
MDAERLERWLVVCPEVTIPAFRHLSAAEAVSVRRGIAYNLGMDNRQIDTNPAQLMGDVHKQSILQESEPGAEASATLRKIFEKTPGLGGGECPHLLRREGRGGGA